MIQALKSCARSLKRDVFALTIAMRDPRTPLLARIVGTLVIAYACSPIDLIPDFIPILGLLDDLILVPAGIALLLRLIPSAVLEEARAQVDERAASGKLVNRTAAVVIVVLWGVVALWLILLSWRMLKT